MKSDLLLYRTMSKNLKDFFGVSKRFHGKQSFDRCVRYKHDRNEYLGIIEFILNNIGLVLQKFVKCHPVKPELNDVY